MTKPTPTSEEIDELLLCSRYGELPEDLESIKQFVNTYGPSYLSTAKDDRGNTCLHMAGANGHDQILEYILPLLPKESLTLQNSSKSTPLHWTTLNYHLTSLRLLCPLLPPSAFLIKNGKGKTALEEAEEACESFVVPEGEENGERGKERVRREMCVGYLVGVMGLGPKEEHGRAGSKTTGEDEDDKVEVTDGVNKITLVDTTTTTRTTPEES